MAHQQEPQSNRMSRGCPYIIGMQNCRKNCLVSEPVSALLLSIEPRLRGSYVYGDRGQWHFTDLRFEISVMHNVLSPLPLPWSTRLACETTSSRSILGIMRGLRILRARGLSRNYRSCSSKHGEIFSRNCWRLGWRLSLTST